MKHMLITLLAFMLAVGWQSQLRAQDLPAGPGKAEVESQCSVCHSLARVVGRKDTPEGWAELVDSMVALGATLSDKKVVVDYLSKNFSDKPAEAPAADAKPAAAPANAPAGSKVDPAKVDIKLGVGVAAEFITEACTQCHALSRITSKGGRTKAEWADLVERMVKRGAALNDLKAAMVVDYLTAAYPK